MDVILIILMILIVSVVVIVSLNVFMKWHFEALDKEYKTMLIEKSIKTAMCPICTRMLNIKDTQKIIQVKGEPHICCINHTNRELVDYYKKSNSEVIKDAKEKDIHG